MTLLDSTNVLLHGLTWDRLTLQVASQVAVTDTLGQLTTAALITPAQGGTGFAFVSSTLNASLVVQANAAGSALTLGTVPLAAPTKIYSFYRFG